MAISLKNKIVFVTGATAGIGEATALEFAKLGAKIMVCGRRAEKLGPLETKLREAGAADVHTFVLDVQSRGGVAKTLEALPEAWKQVEVLVNNAGLSRGLKKMYEDDIQDWEEMIDTNVKGLLYVTRAIVPGMVERKSGHVINLGSIAGIAAYPNGGVYCATKAAERFISDGLRIDLNGTPVRVTTVDPGMAETEFSLVRFRGDGERAAKTYANIDALKAEDIAETIVWTATRPAHVMIQSVVLTCTEQASAYVLSRKS
jgi:3-hydroxy acid dehydrogenase/malonic semialdehyde reductase